MAESASKTAESGGDKTKAAKSTRAQQAQAAPIDAPEARASSSSDPVATSAGQHSLVGQGHQRLVGEDGNPLGEGDLFTEGEPNQTFVHAKQRVLQQYTQQGGRTPLYRLLYAQGDRVPRDAAERLRAALREHSGQ